MMATLALIGATICIVNGSITLARALIHADGATEVQALAWLILGAVILK